MRTYAVELEHHEMRTLITSHHRMADEATADSQKSVGGAGKVLFQVANEYRRRAEQLEKLLINPIAPEKEEGE